jgi:hypothetical protein
MAVFVALPFLLHSWPVRLSSPDPPPLPPLHSSDAHSLFLSRCVCASGFFGVVVAVGCSFRCFGHGREKYCRVLVFVSICSSCVAALSVLNVTQSLWRRHIVNEGSGSGGRISS